MNLTPERIVGIVSAWANIERLNIPESAYDRLLKLIKEKEVEEKKHV